MKSFDYITITNSTIGTTIVNTALTNLININIPDSSKFVSNLQTFSNQLISYKSLKQISFYQELDDMIKQAILLNSSIYSQSQYFNYISSTVDTISEIDRNDSMIISNSLIELTKFLDNFKITFSNLSLELNSTNYFNVYVNQTIFFTQKFINFTQLLFSNIQTVNTTFSSINISLNTLKSNLLTGLNNIYNSLMFVYTTTTTTTTTTTANSTIMTIINDWNEWRPWTNCWLIRHKRNLLTNQTFQNISLISCDSISIYLSSSFFLQY